MYKTSQYDSLLPVDENCQLSWEVRIIPLGVEAGHKAGIFTIAVNTGPLDGQVLLDAGADLLLQGLMYKTSQYDSLLPVDENCQLSWEVRIITFA